ncbi:MAG: acyl-CoA synthetase, partial [Bacteroidota bacterium]
QNTYEMLKAGAAINPQKLALRFFLQGTAFDRPVDYTYSDLMANINQTANMFRDLGLGEKDVVSFVLPNLPETHFTIWGGEAAGIVNAINPLLESHQIAEIMRAAETKMLVTLAPFPKTDLWDKVSQVIEDVPSLETILTIDLGNYLGLFQKMIVNLVRKKAKTGREIKILDFRKTQQKYPSDRLAFKRDIQPEDIASYFHTGGTTGTPKIARHTHFNEVFDAWSAGQNLGNAPERTLFCGLPLFHVNAVIVTGLIPWSSGATVVLGTPQGYRGEGLIPNFWKIVDFYKINFFSGVPTVYQMLLDVPVGDSDISSLDFAICGAAPMPVELFKNFQNQTGVKILEGYGLTEGTCASSCNPAYGDKKIGSIGLRIPYQEMKAVVLDENKQYIRDCEVDEIGTVILRGPNVFGGYKVDSQNKKAFLNLEDGGEKWLNTGDLGRIDQDGYFWLTGRSKELIIRGGHNIDPKMIEEPMHQHPDVALAAAVGRPDPRLGEVPVVYIQAMADTQPTEGELLDFARENIGERAAHPKRVTLIEEMPVTAVGKIFKPKLVWKEIQEVYQIELAGLEGVSACEVEVGAHPSKGVLAEIKVQASKEYSKEAIEAQINQCLGAYSYAYHLIIE